MGDLDWIGMVALAVAAVIVARMVCKEVRVASMALCETVEENRDRTAHVMDGLRDATGEVARAVRYAARARAGLLRSAPEPGREEAPPRSDRGRRVEEWIFQQVSSADMRDDLLGTLAVALGERDRSSAEVSAAAGRLRDLGAPI